MNVRRFPALLFFALVLVTTTAQAQLGVYGNFDVTHDSFSGSSTKIWVYGPNAGAYYNFIHAGPLAAGVDLRGNLLFGDQYKYRSALFGLRLAAKPPLLPIRPYAQFSVGLGGSRFTGISGLPTHYSSKFQYMVFGGLDYTVIPHVDLRLAEIGYGRMSGINNGNSGSNPTDSLLTIGSGVVIRFF